MSHDNGIIVANAPVSYGAFEVTIGFDPNVPDGDAILDEVSAAGYAGIDLGPVGYLGTAETRRQTRASAVWGLPGLSGTAVRRPGLLEETIPELDAMLDIFDRSSPRRSVPTLVRRWRISVSGDGADFRRNNPGFGCPQPGQRIHRRPMGSFAKGMAIVVERCRVRGYQPVFHNETGTFVEAPEEVGRMLEVSDIGLAWTRAISCSAAAIRSNTSASGPTGSTTYISRPPICNVSRAWSTRDAATNAIWQQEVFPRLGEGALDVDAFLGALRDIDYAGWMVVEQDIFPTTAERFAQAAADQRANREFLRGAACEQAIPDGLDRRRPDGAYAPACARPSIEVEDRRRCRTVCEGVRRAAATR